MNYTEVENCTSVYIRDNKENGNTLIRFYGQKNFFEVPSRIKTINSYCFKDAVIRKMVFEGEQVLIESRAFAYSTIKEIVFPDYFFVLAKDSLRFDRNSFKEAQIRIININILTLDCFMDILDEGFFETLILRGKMYDLEPDNLSRLLKLAQKGVIKQVVFGLEYYNGLKAYEITEEFQKAKVPVLIKKATEEGTIFFKDANTIIINLPKKKKEITLEEETEEIEVKIEEDILKRVRGVSEVFYTPAKVKSIRPFVFSNALIKKIVCPQTLQQADLAAFSSPILEEVVLNEGLQAIGAKAFYHSPIKSLRIPASVKEIDPSAFLECPTLESLILNRTLNFLELASFEQMLEDKSAVKYLILDTQIINLRKAHKFAQQLDMKRVLVFYKEAKLFMNGKLIYKTKIANLPELLEIKTKEDLEAFLDSKLELKFYLNEPIKYFMIMADEVCCYLKGEAVRQEISECVALIRGENEDFGHILIASGKVNDTNFKELKELLKKYQDSYTLAFEPVDINMKIMEKIRKYAKRKFKQSASLIQPVKSDIQLLSEEIVKMLEALNLEAQVKFKSLLDEILNNYFQKVESLVPVYGEGLEIEIRVDKIDANMLKAQTLAALEVLKEQIEILYMPEAEMLAYLEKIEKKDIFYFYPDSLETTEDKLVYLRWFYDTYQLEGLKTWVRQTLNLLIKPKIDILMVKDKRALKQMLETKIKEKTEQLQAYEDFYLDLQEKEGIIGQQIELYKEAVKRISEEDAIYLKPLEDLVEEYKKIVEDKMIEDDFDSRNTILKIKQSFLIKFRVLIMSLHEAAVKEANRAMVKNAINYHGIDSSYHLAKIVREILKESDNEDYQKEVLGVLEKWRQILEEGEVKPSKWAFLGEKEVLMLILDDLTKVEVKGILFEQAKADYRKLR